MEDSIFDQDEEVLQSAEAEPEPENESFTKRAVAFASALRQGVLSGRCDADNFIGKYMFMGVDEHGDALFKDSDTRWYLPAVKVIDEWDGSGGRAQLFINAVCEIEEGQRLDDVRETRGQTDPATRDASLSLICSGLSRLMNACAGCFADRTAAGTTEEQDNSAVPAQGHSARAEKGGPVSQHKF